MAGTLAVAVGVAGGLVVFDSLSATQQPALAATPALLSYEYNDSAPPAADYLLRIAAEIQPTAEAAGGPVTYVKTRAWSLDMASAGAETVAAIVPYEQQLWRAPDRSGLTRLTWSEPEFRDDLARREWERSGAQERVEDQTTSYKPGERATVTSEPPSADLVELTEQLYSYQPRENGPKSAIRAVAGLYQDWVLPSSVRVQALRFLANHHELRYRGEVSDRAGREGVAVTFDGDNEQDVIVLDADSGAMLAYESILTKDTQLPVETPAVFSYVLLLDAQHVDSMPLE
jgi:hypothetical protein